MRVSELQRRVTDLEGQIQLLTYQNNLLSDEVSDKDGRYAEKLQESCVIAFICTKDSAFTQNKSAYHDVSTAISSFFNGR